MKIQYILILLLTSNFSCSRSTKNSMTDPPAHLRPRGTTNWTPLRDWERKNYEALHISMEVPKDRQYEEIKFTDPNWKSPPQLAMRKLFFKIHLASRGFLMEPATKISVMVEHYSPKEWKEALEGKRGSINVLGDDPLRLIPSLSKIDRFDCSQVLYRRDYLLPDGSVVIAGATVKLPANATQADADEDEPEIRRILNSVKPL